MIAIALDDEPPALSTITKYCSETDFIDLQKTFTNPLDAIKYIKRFPVDLLFIDIQMHEFNGIEVYKNLPTKPLVIFTTAFSEYAVEGFEVNAVDYLLKPYSYERFYKAAKKAYELFKASRPLEESRFISVRSNYSLVKIKIDDIMLIESFDDYLNICLKDKKVYVVRMTMTKILEELPGDEFVRIHRSYIVPLKRIQTVRNKTVYLCDKKIPVGSKYKKEFFEKFGKQTPLS
jgi:DNA-binding LytR/AlgR family response regulator